MFTIISEDYKYEINFKNPHREIETLAVNKTENLIDSNSNSTDITITDKHGKSADSFWISMLFSMITWIAIIQFLRYIRRISFINSSSYSRQRESIQMMEQLAQLSRSNIPGLSNRLRLALLQRDFNGDDYEMLQQLDEIRGNAEQMRGMSDVDINRLPLHIVTTDDITSNNESEYTSCCNICLGPYEVNDEVRIVACTHRFHKNCIDQWLRTNASCPVCKSSAI